MDASQRGQPGIRRSVRVATPGLRARLEEVEGDLIDVSATGALVRTDREISVGSWPVVLDLEGSPISVVGEVVRCQPTNIERPGAATLHMRAFAIGVKFIKPSADAMLGIARLCGGSVAVEPVPYEIVVVGDEAALNVSIEETLQAAGYRTHSVTDPRTIVTAARDVRADAVVINVSVEQQGSIWWALELLVKDPVTGTIPVVVLSDERALGNDRHQYLSARRVRLLPLPFTPNALLHVLERALIESPAL